MIGRFRAPPPWVQSVVGALLVVGVVVWVGPDAVVRAVHSVDPVLLIAAGVITFGTTAAASWRWVLIAREGGLQLRFRVALSAYYRSQFLNAVLPGGLLGDVDRAVWHSLDQQDAIRASAAVIVERSVGQAIQILLTIGVLLIGGSSTSLPLLVVAGLTLACVLFAMLSAVVASRLHRGGRPIRVRTMSGVVLASTLAVVGYALIFLLAARATGSHASVWTLLPLVMVVIVASALPLNVAGWGPREGVAAWVFDIAGLGAGVGLSASVGYGIISTVAVAPGVVPLLLGREKRTGARSPG